MARAGAVRKPLLLALLNHVASTALGRAAEVLVGEGVRRGWVRRTNDGGGADTGRRQTAHGRRLTSCVMSCVSMRYWPVVRVTSPDTHSESVRRSWDRTQL
jgi:hypothetical protein